MRALRSDSALYLQSLAGAAAIVAVMLAVWAVVWETPAPRQELRPGLGVEFYQRTELLPEPGEQRGFQIALVLTPLVIAAAAWALWRHPLPFRLSAEVTVTGFVVTVCGLIAGLAGCFFGADTMSLFFIRVPVLWCGFVMTAALAAKAWHLDSAGRSRWLAHAFTLLLAVPFVYLAWHELFRGGFDHPADMHNEPILYPLTQVCAGKTLLVDVRSLYGLYPHFLEPVFRVIGLDAVTFGQVMACLMGISMLCVVLALRGTTTRLWTFVLGVLAYFFFPHYALNHPYTYPYLQYYPLRTLFPTVCLALGVWYCARPSWLRALLLLVAAGAAPWWNLDTGLFTVLSVGVLLGHQRLAVAQPERPSRRYLSALLAAGLPLLSVVAWGVLISLGIAWRSGTWPDFQHFVIYQKVFYYYGFAMTPMPATGLWWIPVGIYIVAAGLVVRDYLQGDRDWRLPVISQCVALGTGLLVYYQGRSVYTNLCLCSWPVVVLLTIFADRLWSSIEPAARSAFTGGAGRLVTLHRLGWLCFCVFVLVQLAGTSLATNSILFMPAECHYPLDPEGSYAEPWRRRTAFARDNIPPEQLRRGLLVLSSQDHAWHMALGSRSPSRNAGFNHLFYEQDFEEYLQLLAAPDCRYVLWDDAWMRSTFFEHDAGFLGQAERDRLLASLRRDYEPLSRTTIDTGDHQEEVTIFRRREPAIVAASRSDVR